MKRMLLILAFRYLWVLTQRLFALFAAGFTALAVVSFCKHLSVLGFFLTIIGIIATVSAWNSADLSELRLDMSIRDMQHKLRLTASTEMKQECKTEITKQSEEKPTRRESHGTV